ncbi:MAG: thiol-activated cytolysin family protein [Saprospiraceae bacterium]|nr:thiol-activated cytolysin family protein [Saprospiraceae bacterium]
MKRCLLKLEYKLRIYSLIAFMYILGCGKEKFDINNFAVPPEKEIYDLTLLEQSEPQKKNDTSLCVTEKYKYAPGYEEPVLYDPTSDVIYPGSVLKYESIESGQYIEYVGVKKPITLSISDPNANLTSVVVKDPTLSNVREAIKSLLSSNPTGATTALIVSDFKEIISKEHFELAIGGHFGGFWGSVESDFRFNSQENFRRFMFNFTQTYFTIDVNSKDGNDFFEDNENVFNGNISYSPAYVSSIKYGRRIIITLESKSSSTNLDASLQADFNSLLGGSGSLSVSSELNRSISSQSVKYLIVGGGSLEAVKTIKDIKELKNLLVSGANYSRDSPGGSFKF